MTNESMKNLKSILDSNNSNSTKIIAGIFTFFVLTIILLAGPAKAFILSLDTADDEVDKGANITFTATLEIQSQDEYLPINSLMLNIGGKTCAFDINGNPVGDDCAWVSNIEKTGGSFGEGYGYGYGYDHGNSYGYGYGYNFNFGYGYGYGYGYGTGETELTYKITINTEYFSPKTYQAFLKADIGEKTFKSKPQQIKINTADDEEYATTEKVIVGSGTTEVIVGDDSGSLKEITIPSSIASDKEIWLDLKPVFDSNGDVKIPNDFTLKREGDFNYSVEIPSGTIISGSGWEGKLIMPTVKPNADYSVSSGNVEKVIDLGDNVELNFSQAVKITIGGMAGKKAGWTRGAGALTDIPLVCDLTNNPTNIDAITNRECYIDDGADLVIWTYHFTEFAAYTPTTIVDDDSSSSGSSGGGCLTNWICTDWSECIGGQQTRMCHKEKSYCNAGSRPAEKQTCEDTEDELSRLESEEGNKGFFARMTGAVIGGLRTTTGMIVIVFVLALGGVFVGVRSIRKRNFNKEKKTLLSLLFLMSIFLITNTLFFLLI